jgi:predicted AlkP superfamily phosphohydrolase/phosphomutase
MLSRILDKKGKSLSGSDRHVYLQQLLNLIPLDWRRNIKERLPLSFQGRWTTFWRMGSVDWTVTPAASLVADLQGYIRINLRGREAAGIVEPGEEYDCLCVEIIKGLSTFIDADTGEPVVESVIRSDQLFRQGARLNNLPDLLVRWASSPAANHRAIVSSSYGSIPWPIPGRNPDGRSGNHRPEGFLIAVGDRIQPGSQIKDAHILDLAPTVYALLDLPKPAEMCGNVLSAI